MDLRPYIKTREQLDRGINLIKNKMLSYQPFILADDIEVGEGMNLHDGYREDHFLFDLNAYAKGMDIGQGKQPPDPARFRQCNQEYRQMYEYVCESIVKNVGASIENLSFCELGCNTGLTLFYLALRGAHSCHGIDKNDTHAVFAWLNDILGTNVSFSKASYSNLYHEFEGIDLEPVDVMINTVFTNHQCDPLQFLCYMCDRAKTGVFLWVLLSGLADCAIGFPPAQLTPLKTGGAFPLYFNNGVQLSESLLRVALARLGFEDVRLIDKFVPSEKWDRFQSGFRMFYARRTQPWKSAYWTAKHGPNLVQKGSK